MKLHLKTVKKKLSLHDYLIVKATAPGKNESTGSRVLIAYFSMPEDADTSGVDAISGASIVVRDGEREGRCSPGISSGISISLTRRNARI